MSTAINLPIEDEIPDFNSLENALDILAYADMAKSIDMTLPRKQQEYTYHYCPHCEGLSAFPVYDGNESVVYECANCNGEFTV